MPITPLSLTLLFAIQTPSTVIAPPPTATQAQLHEDALKLVEVSGLRATIETTLSSSFATGAKAMMERCKECAPEFAEEWQKRMKQRSNVDDYLNVYVRTYEKYLDDAEMKELIAIQQSQKTAQPQLPSEALKTKLAPQMTQIMSETMGGCAQVGAKLGGDIALEISKEHPEWMKKSADAPSNPH